MSTGGVARARKVRTTVADPAAERAPDLVKRQFTAGCPDQLWGADFTYVPMSAGFGYTAFVIDAFAGLIVGWECSLSKHTAFVESAIRQATAFRGRQGHPLAGGTIHHSDGTVGDALDNALAETTIGLYKTESVRENSPFRHGPLTALADPEEVTSAWVARYNNDRLMHRLGRRPPAEAEADHYATTTTANPAAHTN